MRNLPRDPGLETTPHEGPNGRYVGHAHGPIRRFAHLARLDRLLQELARGFGPRTWWPAETPFEVIVGAILTQNTAWRNVELALARLREEGWLTPAHLLAASQADLAQRIRPSGTFRMKARKLQAISRWYLDQGGLLGLRERSLGPLREELLGVFGVGPETADSILCYAAGRLTVVVDAYTRRVLSRHGFVAADAGYEEIRAWLGQNLVRSQPVYEEFHALLVQVGYGHCKPSARCEACPATTPVGGFPGSDPGRS